MAADLTVLIVAQPNDPHAAAVEARLAKDGMSVARTSLNAWSSHIVEWSLHGDLLLTTDHSQRWNIQRHTTVWWRRPGWFEGSNLGAEELQLARDESAIMLPGMLDAAGVRWVDQPWTTARARNRLVQLNVAAALGIRVPSTIVTNSTTPAARFCASGKVVAKTISTGPGLAPFVDVVDPDDLELVRNAPVLLQRLIHAAADWRLVTVGLHCVAWRRTRKSGGAIDWRANDPEGVEFRPVTASQQLVGQALLIQEQLGLSFSVQDWVEVGSEWFFLEVNPQGQWLFLDGAEQLVSERLAAYLSGSGQ